MTVGTAALVVGGDPRGGARLGSPTTLGCFALAVVSFALFVLVERRAAEPIVPLDVFRVRPVTVANGLSALVGGALPATMFFLALYLQRVLGMNPLQAGLALTPGAIGIALGARGASRWLAVLGPRRSFQLGTLLSAGALFWLSGIDVEGRYAVDVLVPFDPRLRRLRRRRAAADGDGDVRPRSRAGGPGVRVCSPPPGRWAAP